MFALLILLSLYVVHGRGKLPFPLNASHEEKTPQFHLAASQPPVCPYTAGKLHLLTSPVPSIFANQACEAMGWRLAAITSQNEMYAMSVSRICNSTGAFVASYNGLNANPCMALIEDGFLVLNIACGSSSINVLCEEVPVETVTQSTTTTLTTTTGVSFAETTTTVTKHHHHHGYHKAAEANNPLPQCNKPPQTSCNECSAVCSSELNPLKVVRIGVEYSDANDVCARYGLVLADYTDGMQSYLVDILEKCALNQEGLGVWINSVNGVTGGMCTFASAQANQTLLTVGLGSSFCSLGQYEVEPYVLCMPLPAFPTGLGPYEGSVTLTTVQSIATATETVPQTTITSTVTVYRKKPRKPSSSDSSSSSDDSHGSF